MRPLCCGDSRSRSSVGYAARWYKVRDEQTWQSWMLVRWD